MRNTASFTVTDFRLAFECPRLFYLVKRFGGDSLFLPKDAIIGLGSAFHQLATQFVEVIKKDPTVNTLFTPSADKINLNDTASALQQVFYEQIFFIYIENNSQYAEKLLNLWDGFKKLIIKWTALLIQNRRFCDSNDLILNTFIAQELKVSHIFKLSEDNHIEINGRLDSLLYNFERQQLQVVELKAYELKDPTPTLAQAALYGFILTKTKGLPIDSVIYSVIPNWNEYSFSHKELEDTVNKLIPLKLSQMVLWLKWTASMPNKPPKTTQPFLCTMCPQQKKCEDFFKDNTHGAPLIDLLKAHKINADYLGYIKGVTYDRIKIKPHKDVKINKIVALDKDIKVQLSLIAPPIISPQAGYLSVDIPCRNRTFPQLEDFIKPSTNHPTDIKIPIGINIDGKLVEAQLSNPSNCHFLIGGTTGSGKSEFLRALITSLTLRYSPNDIKIVLVDPKRVTFGEFKDMKWLMYPIVKEKEEAISLMEDIKNEMRRRYALFEDAGCIDILSYKKESLYRIVIIFDEFADFMTEKPIKEQLETNVKILGAMARAAGIHLLIATQRPEAKVVTPLIRANLPGRIALKTASEADSEIILGGRYKEAAKLLGKGDLLYIGELPHPLRLQSLYANK